MEKEGGASSSLRSCWGVFLGASFASSFSLSFGAGAGAGEDAGGFRCRRLGMSAAVEDIVLGLRGRDRGGRRMRKLEIVLS